MLTNIVPDAWRKGIYAAYAVVAAALTVTQTVYATTLTPQPSWLTITLAIVVAVGAAIGAVANANVTPAVVVPDATVPTAADPNLPSD